LQIKRYTEWLTAYIGEAHGILVAPGITPNALNLLRKEGIDYKKINVGSLYIRHIKDKTLREWL
jgi:RecB family endonuclease NucS